MKAKSKKRKGMLKMMLIVCFVILLFLLGCFVNHRIQSNKEKDLLTPLGKMVSVNGKEMSVYLEGSGDKTLVFLAGSGTASPILDFKALYSQLGEGYRIVVVEKFGYGFSDDNPEAPRDVDSVLSDTRAALMAADVEGPYVLLPHSLSGIEALRWAQKYPEEVEAIIGLDMALPTSYEKMNIGSGQLTYLKAVQIARKIGLLRLIPVRIDAFDSGALTEKERDIYKAVYQHCMMSQPVINEGKCIKESAALVAQEGYAKVPMLLFVSDGTEVSSLEEWRTLQAEFAKDNGGEVVYLECGHYVHNHEPQLIADKIEEWLCNK